MQLFEFVVGPGSYSRKYRALKVKREVQLFKGSKLMKELLNAKAGKIETGHRFYFGSVGDQKKKKMLFSDANYNYKAFWTRLFFFDGAA